MSYNITVLSFFTPIILTALAVILAITLRWFSHKERMALIAQGLPPEDKPENREKHKAILAMGLIVGLLGLALSIGLLTLGMGPWLLAGLIPLFSGLALVLVSLVLQPSKPKKKPEQETVGCAEKEPAQEIHELEEEKEQQLA